MSATTQRPIIFTPRAEVRDAVRQELKALSVEEVIIPGSVEQCIEKLITNSRSLLVIDWDVGSEDVNQILSAIKGFFNVETRPVFLITPELDPHIIATGAEYGVSQIHAGPISRLAVRECLDAVLHEDDETREIREKLVQVATARSKGDWSIVTPILQEMHERMPNQVRVAVELAENLIYEDNWREALSILRPLISTEPPNIRALHLMGRCFMQKGDYDQAIGLLSRAKVINPHNVGRLIDLGESFLRNNQVEEAMENFKDALALDEGNKKAKVGAGKCMMITGEVNEALTLLKEVSGPRELASIFNTSAVLAVRQKRFDQGIQLYQSALKALGHDDFISARLIFNMGLGFARWQKADKAKMCFEKSLELDPTYDKASKYKDLIEKIGSKMVVPKEVPAYEDIAEEEFTQGPKSTEGPSLGDFTQEDWEPGD